MDLVGNSLWDFCQLKERLTFGNGNNRRLFLLTQIEEQINIEKTKPIFVIVKENRMPGCPSIFSKLDLVCFGCPNAMVWIERASKRNNVRDQALGS